MEALPWLSAFVVMGALAYIGAPLWVWTLIAFAVLSFQSFMMAPLNATLTVLWVLFIIIAAVLNIPIFRQALFSRYILGIVKAKMPPISDTEREAINAGDIWWEAQLFRGRPQWHDIQSFQITKLSETEQTFVDHQVEILCHMIDTWQQSQDAAHSEQVWNYLKKERFFSMLIPRSYGGLEFSALAQSTVVSKIASRDMSTAVTVMVPNSLGPAELILHYGTEHQKQYYLPRLASGQDIPCFGLTALEAGSDAAGMSDKGIVTYGQYEGKRVLGLTLTFSKRYITLAPVATVLGIAFKCFDPQKLLSEKINRGITLCLIPADYPGVETGDYHLPIGSSFPNGTFKGKDIFIPLDWVIGGADNIGHGWHMLMECLSAGRGISLPALATASAKLSYRTTGAYAQVRKQFNMPIAAFEGIQADMARIAGFTYILESMRVVTASAISHGKKPSVVSAIAKYHMTELSRKAVNHAMDIHAGRAVINGPSNYLANTYSMLPVAITVEGANILTRNLIIFGQGAIRCHPHLLHEMLAAQGELDFRMFDKHLMKHMGYTLTNAARTLIRGLTAGRLVMGIPQGDFHSYAQQITRMSTALAFVSDISLILLGGNLKRMENLSARLGDVLSYLYMATTVIKYYDSTKISAEEQSLARWALDYCLYQCQIAWNGFFDNFPYRVLAIAFRAMVFPYGSAYAYPTDALSQRVAKVMMASGPLRDKVTENMFVGNEQTSTGALEEALMAQQESQPAWDKIMRAQKEKKFCPSWNLLEKMNAAHEQKIISRGEYEQLTNCYKLYIKAIAVDEFHG